MHVMDLGAKLRRARMLRMPGRAVTMAIPTPSS
jgi:hypothetical protein